MRFSLFTSIDTVIVLRPSKKPCGNDAKPLLEPSTRSTLPRSASVTTAAVPDAVRCAAPAESFSVPSSKV